MGWLLNTLGKSADALAALRLARADQEALAAAPEASNDARHGLAGTVQRIGALLAKGNPSQAEAEFRMALAIRQKLADDHPAVTDFRSRLAHSTLVLAILLGPQAGRKAEAEAEFRMALALYRKLTEDNPKVPGHRYGAAWAQRKLSVVVRSLGRPAEARDLCDRAVAVCEALSREDPKMLWYRYGLAESHFYRCLAHRALGDPAGATADARRVLDLLEGLESLWIWVWYLRGACHAVLAGLAGSGISTEQAAAEADAAMAVLHQAVAMGHPYADASFADAFRTDDAFDPLRGREDFRLMMMDLAFPAEPFAAPR
jgi:tetratricopeptide (TPR) repeat protein